MVVIGRLVCRKWALCQRCVSKTKFIEKLFLLAFMQMITVNLQVFATK